MSIPVNVLKRVLAGTTVYVRFGPKQLLDEKKRMKIAQEPRKYISLSALGFGSKEELLDCLKDDRCVDELIEAICIKLKRGELNASRALKSWTLFCLSHRGKL